MTGLSEHHRMDKRHREEGGGGGGGGGDDYYHPKAKGEYMDRGPPSWCKLCGGGRAPNITCHYHPSILDNRGVPNPKTKPMILKKTWI